MLLQCDVLRILGKTDVGLKKNVNDRLAARKGNKAKLCIAGSKTCTISIKH